MGWLRKNFPIVATVVMTLLLFAVAGVIPHSATGDSGDSVLHYLYSRYARQHPGLYFDHWAKPLFVVLSSPFSTFGFKGIVAFNIFCAALTSLFTYYTAKALDLHYAALAFIIPLFAPLYFLLAFSGLTEYLFALLLSIGFWLLVTNRYLSCALVVSFLPMVRSEGLIVCLVLGIYLMGSKRLKLIPALLTGQIIFSVAGFFHHHDFFWIWTKIPYASFDSPYGNGKLQDFIFRLMYAIEKPLFVLMWAGVIVLIYRIDTRHPVRTHLIVILATFLAFFFAHGLFWWLGIFNSMGLPRVLNAVLPLIVVLVLVGFRVIVNLFPKNTQKIVFCSLLTLILLFPFTYRAKGIVYRQDAFVVPEVQLLQDSLRPYLERHFTNYQQGMFYYRHPAISLVMNHDYFNWKNHQYPGSLLSYPPEKGLLIWDNWFSKNEDGIELRWLLENRHLIFKKSFVTYSKNGLYQFCVFEVN